MAELTFKSPGVSTREIDLSGPRRVGPTGVPAGVIGTSQKGRAFVPLVFADFTDFVAEFGGVSSDQFGPMALREWFANAQAGLYLKVLGVGDAKSRLDAAGNNSRGEELAAGSVVNAGFVVGQKQVNPNSGNVEDNLYAGEASAAAKASATIVITTDAASLDLDGDDFILVDFEGTKVTFTIDHDSNTVMSDPHKAAPAATIGLGSPGNEKAIALALIAGINAHNIKITATHLTPDAGDEAEHKVKIEQDTAGKAGNTVLPTPSQALTAVTMPAAFTGGLDSHVVNGRTYFLGSLLKETGEVATAKISYTGQPADGNTITLVSVDGTSKTYEFDDDNSVTGSNVRVIISADDADATYAALATAVINSSNHENKITVSHTDDNNQVGDITFTQVQAGRDGNTVITATVTNATIPASFSGGKGARIFEEAGSGKANANTGIKFAPVLRGVLMAPNGIVPALSASRIDVPNNTPVGQPGLGASKARAVVTFTDAPGNAETIVIVDQAGLSKTYTATSNASNPNNQEDPPEFNRGDGGGNAAESAVIAAASLAAAINSNSVSLSAGGHGGALKASADGAKVVIVNTVGGVAGNTVITDGLTNASKTDFTGGQAPPSVQRAAHATSFGGATGYDNGGSPVGAVNVHGARQEFTMLLNGHKPTASYPSVLTASFDPMSSNYFPKLFNTDPTRIQEAGHYLYTYYDVFSSYALPDGTAANPLLKQAYVERVRGSSGDGSLMPAHGPSNVLPAHDRQDIGFLFPMAGDRNKGTTTRANAENFSDRFRTAATPSIISQRFGAENKDLFKVHALDDGANGGAVFKITIENLKPSRSEKDRYGTFDLNVRSFSDNDREPLVLESFKAVSLNPISDRYIARVIGDQRIFYDFDKRAGSQKLVISGKFPNNSRNIRVEVSGEVDRGEMDPTALPVGFRGVPKLNIDNATSISNPSDSSIEDTSLNASVGGASIKTPPLNLRRSLGLGQTPKMRVNANLTWGVQFEADDLGSEPNKNSRMVAHMRSLTKYFPDFDQDNLSLLEKETSVSDAYNKNKFTLENIQVLTNSAGSPDTKEWPMALYRRSGVLATVIKDIDGNDASGRTRFLNMTSDLKLGSVRKFLKFTFFAQGGFDGVEIFDSEKSKLTDVAVMREISNQAAQGGKNGPTAATYMKAVDVLAEKSDVDIQLLAIPGIRQPIVTDRAIEAVEDRFDAMLIMDTIPYDFDAMVVTGSNQKVSVSQTVSKFSNRVLDSSFAASYFPDVILQDPTTGQNVQVPPSVPVLGAFSLNDSLAHPWFAPAGFTRGAMENVVETKVKLNRDNLDSLYEADVNPLTAFPHSDGVVVFGQKTLLRTQSSLDRVNVRRLLIEIRRRVRSIANSFIFEPNRESTLARFSAQVNPVLRQIQQQQGVDRFLVRIDTTTTTQTDVENNTLRGKIFLQPTRSVEFVSLDFVITNAGAEI